MIKHVVMWRLWDSAQGFTKAENAQRMKQKLEGLEQSIPEIRHLEVGINVNTSADAFDIVLYSAFENRDDLAAYQNHPTHLEFKAFIDEMRAEKRVVDYESG